MKPAPEDTPGPAVICSLGSQMLSVCRGNRRCCNRYRHDNTINREDCSKVSCAKRCK